MLTQAYLALFFGSPLYFEVLAFKLLRWFAGVNGVPAPSVVKKHKAFRVASDPFVSLFAVRLHRPDNFRWHHGS